MTTPSGPIGLGHVQTEFGGSNPISLSEYYRGGSLVPAGTVAGTSGVQIATSGAIRLGDFRAVTAFGRTVNIRSTLGAGVETVPSGANSVVIEVWGGGGDGGNGATATVGGCALQRPGGGAGGGGYSRSSYACSAGQTINYTVGAESGASTVSSGTLSVTTMTANGGGNGGNAVGGSPGSNGTAGTGGTASGGNQANTTGNSGAAGVPDCYGGAGGAGITGSESGDGSPYGAGGSGGLGTGSNGTDGQQGRVVFVFYP
jgi:hypothetical protein